MWGVGGQRASYPAVRAVDTAQSPAEGEKPAWVAEITELIRAMAPQLPRRPQRPVSVGGVINLDIWSEIALVPTRSRETP